MLHSVEFTGRPAQPPRYSNRWVRTAKWHAEDVAQRPLASGFVDSDILRLGVNAVLNAASAAGTLPFILADVSSVTGGSGTANTSVVHHAGKVFALQEGSKPVVVNMPHLTTEGALKESKGFTAHPKACPVTGELMWFNYGSPAGLTYGVWDRDGRPVHETVVQLPHNVMVHDIAVTRHYTVILDCPLILTPNLLKGQGPVHLDNDVPMRLGVFPRHGNGKDVEWYEVPGPGKMCFHVMNAYEHNSGEIVVIGCAQPKVSIGDMNVQHAQKERLTEWRIDPQTRLVNERVLSEMPCDFPRVNERFMGQPFRFGYAAAFDPDNRHGTVPRFNRITKHDVRSAETFVWEGSVGVCVGEPIFVPRVGASLGDEDDGYVLVYARDETRRSSEVFIFDAQDFGNAPLCRVQLPRRVPYGFHVAWVPAEL